MRQAPFTVTMPSFRATSVIFASPHSGRAYPEAFLRSSILDERAIRSSEDAFVDLLFTAAPDFGAPLLAARAPRAYIDLNRGPEELDPAVVADVRRSSHNPRVTSGLGVVPRVVANGRAIYRGKISRTEAETRLNEVWHPYHRRLQSLLHESLKLFGEAILMDCHSMPHEAIESISQGAVAKPQIVLGDRFGAAAGQDVVDRIEDAFLRSGLRVARNSPFAGAYVTQQYGRPSRFQHVVQIEIDRGLYMDEKLIRPSADFKAFQATMRDVITRIAAIGARDMPLAAE